MLLLESDLGLYAMARRYVCRFRRLCRFRRTCFSRLKFRNFKLKENPTYHYPGISLASLLSVANVDRFFLHVYMPESEVPGSSFFIPIRLRDRFRDLSSLDFDTDSDIETRLEPRVSVFRFQDEKTGNLCLPHETTKTRN